MEEPWGEEERAASELDSRVEAWDTAYNCECDEECVSSWGDTKATIALAIQEWDDQQQRAAEAEEAAMAGERSEGVLAEELEVMSWQTLRLSTVMLLAMNELADEHAAAAAIGQWRRELQKEVERAAADRGAAEGDEAVVEAVGSGGVLAESPAVDELFDCDYCSCAQYVAAAVAAAVAEAQGAAAVVVAAVASADAAMDMGVDLQIAAALTLAAEAYTMVAEMAALEGTKSELAAAFATATAASYAAYAAAAVAKAALEEQSAVAMDAVAAGLWGAQEEAAMKAVVTALWEADEAATREVKVTMTKAEAVAEAADGIVAEVVAATEAAAAAAAAAKER